MIYDITNTLENIPTIISMFPWWITNEAPLTAKVFPYMYVDKFEYWSKNGLTRRAHVDMSIVWSPEMVSDDIEVMFWVIDNEILTNIDWCSPISVRWNAVTTEITSGTTSKTMRDMKENIVIRKTYNFTYLTQT